MLQYNCQNGQSWYDVCLNTYGSFNYLSKLMSDNNAELNIPPFTGQSIFWDKSLVKDNGLLSLITANGYIYSTNIPISIQSYTAGKSTIGFASDGSDGWDISIVANPTTVQLPNSETITGVSVEVLFWNGGSENSLYSNTYTTDQVLNTGANGAGMYEVLLTYNVSDGSQFQIFALIVVNATNTILAYYKMLGVAVSNVNGLNIDVDADISQSGTLSIDWIATDGIASTMVGSGDTDTLTLFPTTSGVGQMVTLDSNFSDYPNAEYFSGFSVSIN